MDVDCYVTGPVPIEKLQVLDWIAQTFHVIKRDSRKFLGE